MEEVLDWFEKNYKQLDVRYDTMLQTIELIHGRFESPFIVETGCVKQKEDWGAGQSSIVFSDYLSRFGKKGRLTSVDLSLQSVAFCKDATSKWDHLREVVHSDSVKFLNELPKDIVIDLLYLDSWDYPYGELLDVYGGKTDIHKAISILGAMSDEEIVEKHNDIIEASQNHCVAEIEAALPNLRDNSIILIDDNKLPGGGKPRLAKLRLEELGYKCLRDEYQTLWIKKV